MKKNTPLIARIASITGLLLGAFALSAIAGTWTAAPYSPSDGCVKAMSIPESAVGQSR